MARKLRVDPLSSSLHLVLVEPEIPQNTGNIARLCAATQSELHLVGRLGFRVDEKAVRRAGLDYWHLVKLSLHSDFSSFTLKYPTARLFLLSANAAKSYTEMDIRPGDALVFGKESVGLPRELTSRYSEQCFGIPTSGAVRSINLASAAAIVTYEALRKLGGLENSRLEESAEANDDKDFPR